MAQGDPPPGAEGGAIQVVVMAKYPAAGRVKTRLATRFGAEVAADLYRAFLRDLAERLEAAGLSAVWAFWPPEAPFQDVLPGARLLPQQGNDLGQRMAGVAARVFAQLARGVILLGADAPHVDLRAVQAAARMLGQETHEVVLGPAEDGGYYLLGLRRLIPELFRDIDWGGPRVCADTEARLSALGVRYGLVAPDFDVDQPADLARLADLLRRGTLSLPHTAAALARARLS